jgi:hypothetical protein
MVVTLAAHLFFSIEPLKTFKTFQPVPICLRTHGNLKKRGQGRFAFEWRSARYDSVSDLEQAVGGLLAPISAPIAAPRDTRIREGRHGHADDVDEY